MKFGYALQKSQGNSRNGYQHLYLTIYAHQEDWNHWQPIVEISWQSDQSNDYWYGFRLQTAPSLTSSYFATVIRFFQRIEKAGKYDSSAETFINWLKGLRGVTQIAWDNRISQYVTIEKFRETEHQFGFQLRNKENGSLWDVILAEDILQAELLYGDKFNVDLHYEVNYEFPYGIDEWLKLPEW